MNSMTGYGRAQVECLGRLVSLEISSVNRRNLELTSSLPREWQGMERVIAEQVRGRFQRGKFHVQLQLRALSGPEAEWDAGVIQQRFKELQKIAGQNLTTDASFWLRLAAYTQDNQADIDWEDAWNIIAGTLGEALDSLAQMRATEGQALADDIRQRLERMEAWRVEIAGLSGKSVEYYRETLMERLKKAGLELELDDERVLKEISIFADRCDVEEELTRLASHLMQFQDALGSEEQIGRKLDFMCQEINREVNTIGSKANNLEITRLVIECKNELERIREQVQNIE
ncbi:YicC/YloC family endoribonuclease [Cerasicoccus frondis]|uniref:YicC/YloC family endoribonuclease n=1 Tax=Cerasicoccus frondis TaxID=490090 RepID=UPI0028529B59|nr:YicC/YloC family endoribonuclease [Cerasicoccus frondis]